MKKSVISTPDLDAFFLELLSGKNTRFLSFFPSSSFLLLSSPLSSPFPSLSSFFSPSFSFSLSLVPLFSSLPSSFSLSPLSPSP
ncbi:hypothetical protein ACQJ1S_26090, partial [Klebsiella pneumoniae]